RDVKAGLIGVWTIITISCNVPVNQTRIDCGDSFIGQVESFTHVWWVIDDKHIGPTYQLAQNLLPLGTFQIQGHTAFIAIGQLPRVVLRGLRGLILKKTRYSSPVPGISILMTSAPKSDRMVVAAGPAIQVAISSTLRSENRFAICFSPF